MGETLVTYKLERTATGSGVGWFTCVPSEDWDLVRALKYLEGHPYDIFMHKYVLEKLGAFEPNEFVKFIDQNKHSKPYLRAIIHEAWIRNWKFESFGIKLEKDILPLAEHSPLIDIRWAISERGKNNLYWLKCFASNFYRHTNLPSPEQAEQPLPYERDQLKSMFDNSIHVKELSCASKAYEPGPKSESPKAFIKSLNRTLERLNILCGWETRTEATLSPFAVERPWILDISIKDGRNQFRLEGTQVSYGRGLNIHQARISCLMETVERYCAFASIKDGMVDGYLKCGPLIKSTYDDLLKKGYAAVDPNDMCLEVPYDGYPILWIQAEAVTLGGKRSVHVPAQLVFLFANFDEMSLTSGVSSTGLGAGVTIEDAKLSALHEIIERDAEKVVPYFREKCFRLQAEDDRICDLLEFMERKGIHVQFLDLTSEFGVPCYKAFICGPGGVILKGTGANLDAKRAILSALTEIPYPYPYWFGSMEPMEDIPVLQYEELPDYSTKEPKADLNLLETLLLKNGYEIIYVDLTRKELGLPVVRALVPGLEFMTFFDRYTPLPARQFAHYLLNQSV